MKTHTKFKTFIYWLISLRIGVWRMLFLLILAIVVVNNQRLKEVITMYEDQLYVIDSIATQNLIEMDSIRAMLELLENDRIIFDSITHSISQEYEMLYERPEEFAALYFKNKDTHFGGGNNID